MSLITYTVCGLRRMTLILKLMSLREKQKSEWVYEWHTYRDFMHLWLQNLTRPSLSSFSGLSIILLSSLLLVHSSFEVFHCHGLYPCFYWSSLPAVSSQQADPTLPCFVSHQESFKLAWCIAMAINSTVTGERMGVKLVTMCEHWRKALVVIFYVSSRWRGRCEYRLFKSMMACDLSCQVAGHQLSPFEYQCVCLCVCVQACVRSPLHACPGSVDFFDLHTALDVKLHRNLS